MFALTNPIALLGLLTISLPLVIHLLQKGSGPVVKVGSLNPYRSVEKHRFWKLEPRQKLLLLLRIACLVLLVLFLAGFHWKSDPAAETGQKWVLVSPSVVRAFSQTPLAEPIQKTKNTMEGFLAEGYQRRFLTPGFPKIDQQRPIAPATEPLNYWSLAAEAADLEEGPNSIQVFADSFAGNYKGSRPPLNFSWITVPLAAANHWVEQVQNLGNGKLRVILGKSDGQSTQFETYLWSSERDPASFPFEVADKRLQMKESDGFPADDVALIPNPTPLKVGLFFSETRREDAQFLKAALRAMKTLGSPLEFVEYGEKMTNPPPLQWILWLSEKPVPGTLRQQIQAGAWGLADAVGQPDWVTTPLLWGPGHLFPPPEIRRRIDPGTSETGLWFAGDGKPVLTVEPVGQGRLYHFHSRFHPTWTNLVFHEAFPRTLHQLKPTNNPGSANPIDTRWLDPTQITPAAVNGTSPMPRQREKPHPSPLLWATALLCFLAERWLSDRTGP